MKKLRVGVWLYGKLNPEMGGVYAYYQELISVIKNHQFQDAEIIFLNDGINYSKDIECKRILWKPRRMKILKLFLNFAIKIHPLGKDWRKKLEKQIKKEVEKLKSEIYQYVDIIYYPGQSCSFPEFPYIYTLWDLAHMSTYAFPELCGDGAFESRDEYHYLLAHKALMVFVASETGKKECKKFLNLQEDRIKVVPIFSSGVIDKKCTAKKPPKLKDDEFFIHYPAQYWAHKNHYNLLAAMPQIIKKFPKIRLVLTGSDKGNKKYITDTINELKIQENIIELGFISSEELRWLYENSQGLVFPSLLSPISMPLPEAAELGCPVACANLEGRIEQLGEYGYYFNALDANDIARQVIAMISDKNVNVPRKYGHKFTIENAVRAIDEAFTEIKNVRFMWDI